MATNKKVHFGPVALSATLTTNVLNPPTLTGGTNVPPNSTNSYIILTKIRILNKTGSAATFSFWLGATGANTAGTEVIGQGVSVAANSTYDWYGQLRMDTTDYLVGGASAGTTLTFEAEGEIGVS